MDVVGVDADDTLWDEASLFQAAEDRFVAGIASVADQPNLRTRLRRLHVSLIAQVGYGPAGYRTALRQFVRGELAPARQEEALVLAEAACNAIETACIIPLPGIADGLRRLRGACKVLLITKGDPAWQARKLQQSGLAGQFDGVHIVPEKDAALYRRLLRTPSAGKATAMIGNSLKSDIVPAMTAGAYGLHVPHTVTSPLEHLDWSGRHRLFHRFADFPAAVDWVLNKS